MKSPYFILIVMVFAIYCSCQNTFGSRSSSDALFSYSSPSLVTTGNFTLTLSQPQLTIFNAYILGHAYEVNFSINIIEGELSFKYGSYQVVDYPCCTSDKATLGNHTYSLQLTGYLNLSIPTTYLLNGTEVFTVNKSSGSFSIASITDIPVQHGEELHPFLIVYLWIRQLFPILVLGIIAIVFYIVKKKS